MNRLNKEGMKAVAHSVAQLGWEDEDIFTFFLQLANNQLYRLGNHRHDFYLDLCIYLSSDCHFMFDMIKCSELEGKEFNTDDWMELAMKFYEDSTDMYKL